MRLQCRQTSSLFFYLNFSTTNSAAKNLFDECVSAPNAEYP